MTPATPDPDRLLAAKLRAEGRYPRAAYEFVQEALEQGAGTDRHVSPTELLAAFADLAREQFGPLTRVVLTSWGVNTTSDVGHIVFDLIDVGLFGKSESDRKADFDGIFEFEDAFPETLGDVRVLPPDTDEDADPE